MAGAKWICFCGSEKIKAVRAIKPKPKGRGIRAIVACCNDCQSRLIITKHGMVKIDRNQWN